MIELQGKYNTAKIFATTIDNATTGQVIALLNQQSIYDSKIRIMPDTHAGKGCVIGTTMTIHDKVIPNLVGVDIGCGMLTIKLKETRIDLPKLDSLIKKNVPSGFDIRKRRHKYLDNVDINKLHVTGINANRIEHSLGTLGGGNHFIEVDRGSDGTLYLVIHTGSRILGKQVAEIYQDKAWKSLSNRDKIIQETIEKLKSEGKQSEIEETVKYIKQDIPAVPKELAYCEGELFNSYIHDMKIVQDYAYWNREAIAETILKEAKLTALESFHTVHNYVNMDDMILRKGAISARQGERVLIPMNMRDGSLLCIGKGNEDYNYSAPHGAGRLMSRSEAKQSVTLSAFKETMKQAGVFSTSVNKSTIDESPMAYKPMQEIIDNVADTVDIVEIIKPIYNFKAGEE